MISLKEKERNQIKNKLTAKTYLFYSYLTYNIELENYKVEINNKIVWTIRWFCDPHYHFWEALAIFPEYLSIISLSIKIFFQGKLN